MHKQALHADDRLKERTSLPPEALTRLRQHLQKTHLPRGTHHVRLGPHGYAVLKDTGKRHVVATVLSRHMTAPGKDVTTRLEFGLSKEEAGHYNMGGGAGLKKLRYIFRPQDVRQVGEWAGKQRPYTQLPQGRRKVTRNFEREVREEIRTGKPKNRSRWFENIPLIGLGSGLVGLGVAADRRR